MARRRVRFFGMRIQKGQRSTNGRIGIGRRSLEQNSYSVGNLAGFREGGRCVGAHLRLANHNLMALHLAYRNLRNKLYKESYEFVRQQRIQCLLQGAWFMNAIPQGSPRETIRHSARPWRFIRLVSISCPYFPFSGH